MLYKLVSEVTANFDDLTVSAKFKSREQMEAFLFMAGQPQATAEKVNVKPELSPSQIARVERAKKTPASKKSKLLSNWDGPRSFGRVTRPKVAGSQTEILARDWSGKIVDNSMRLFLENVGVQSPQVIVCVHLPENHEVVSGLYVGQYDRKNHKLWFKGGFDRGSLYMRWLWIGLECDSLFKMTSETDPNFKALFENNDDLGFVVDGDWLYVMKIDGVGEKGGLFSYGFSQGTEVRWNWSSAVIANNSATTPVSVPDQMCIVAQAGDAVFVFYDDCSSVAFVPDNYELADRKWDTSQLSSAWMQGKYIDANGLDTKIEWGFHELTNNDPSVVVAEVLDKCMVVSKEEFHLADASLAASMLGGCSILDFTR